MRVEKYTKLKDNRYKVNFDNQISINLYDDVIIKYNLLAKKEITHEEFMDISNYNDSLIAYYKAIKYLTIKMRCQKELENYLSRLKIDFKTISDTINKIREEGYLNEDSYIQSYINDQVALTLNGPYKIQNNLVNLGLKEEAIKQFLEKVNDQIWIEKIEKIINKRLNSKSNDSIKKKKEKLIQHLINLGYEREIIQGKVDEINITNDNSLIIKEGNKIYAKLQRKYQGYELKRHFIAKMLLKGFDYEEINVFLNEIE